MQCDYAVTFGNQGLDVDASNKVITAVARRLKESGFEVDAALAVAGSAQAPGLSGTVEANDAKAAADRICEVTQRTLYQFGQSGWNVMCGAWPHQDGPATTS